MFFQMTFRINSAKSIGSNYKSQTHTKRLMNEKSRVAGGSARAQLPTEVRRTLVAETKAAALPHTHEYPVALTPRPVVVRLQKTVYKLILTAKSKLVYKPSCRHFWFLLQYNYCGTWLIRNLL